MAAPDQKKAKEQTLALALEGRWSHAEMAERVGVSTRTIERWCTHPDFRQRLEAMRSDLAASLRDTAYAHKTQRIIGLSQMAESARREYEAQPWLQEKRQIGFSRTDDGESEPLYLINESFNRDAHAAFRDALNDIAKELGERGTNVKISGGLQHSLIPTGTAKTLADDLLAAVQDIPEARIAISARLLAIGA